MQKSTSDDPIVPKPRPPLSCALVRKSPAVAPKGRVRTNAIQNRIVLGMGVKKWASTMTAMRLPISNAPPAKPRPELSARKSPSAVPSVLEKRIAVQ